MIMPNTDKTEETHRIFKKILDRAQDHWGEIYYDYADKLARGILTTKEGVFPSELSFDDQKNYLSLTVRLRVNGGPTATRSQSFLRFQNRCVSLLCFVAYDDEDSIATVRAKTAVPATGSCAHAVGSVFNDTLSLLEDSSLHELLN